MGGFAAEYSDYIVWFLGCVTLVIVGTIGRITGRIRALEDWKTGLSPSCSAHNNTLDTMALKVNEMDDKLSCIQKSISKVHIELGQRVAYLEGSKGERHDPS